MKLTDQIKNYIDSLDYHALLHRWRFGVVGDPMFQDESGKYWGKRMTEMRADPSVDAVQASKDIGWEQ